VLVFWPHSVFWTKSLVCNDTSRGFYYLEKLQSQKIFNSLSAVRMIEPSRPDAHLSLFNPSGRHAIPSGRHVSPSGPSTVSRRFYPAYICPDISAARPDASQYSNSLKFFPSSNKGKIDQPSERCGIPSGCASP
jgi:hypothetical protein